MVFKILFKVKISAKTILGSGGEVVTSPPLNRKVGSSRPTMIRGRSLRVRQKYPAQKNKQKIACIS